MLMSGLTIESEVEVSRSKVGWNWVTRSWISGEGAAQSQTGDRAVGVN